MVLKLKLMACWYRMGKIQYMLVNGMSLMIWVVVYLKMRSVDIHVHYSPMDKLVLESPIP
ncbi:unnamed protein product [Schistosoma mattheei]|uniref:Uncharacterized protein n=1 Tax=Schistosoma mattheei TaxID=31246 RepID=A0A183NYU0_9TREM|nr:unnamed protein product [Schistosoma mattheei]